MLVINRGSTELLQDPSPATTRGLIAADVASFIEDADLRHCAPYDPGADRSVLLAGGRGSALTLGDTQDDIQGDTAYCLSKCAFDGIAKPHHDRLVAIEADPSVFLDLVELAVTWAELEYCDRPIIPPDRWMAFVLSHSWPNPDRAERMFSVATDIARAAAV